MAKAVTKDRIEGPGQHARKWILADRRAARRTFLFEEVLWRSETDTKAHRGILVGVSDTGLALLADREDAPRPGTRFVSSRTDKQKRWRRAVVVQRVEAISENLGLVCGRYAVPGIRESRSERNRDAR